MWWISARNMRESLYEEYAEELGFLLREMHFLGKEDDIEWTYAQQLVDRINLYRHAIEVGKDKASRYLLESLHTFSDDILVGAVFALGSENNDSRIIDEVISAFLAEDDDDRKADFVLALKYVERRDLSERLFAVLKGVEEKKIKYVVDIIGYRGNINPKKLWVYLNDKDSDNRASTVKALSRMGYKEALDAIEQVVLSNKEKFCETSVLPLLILDSNKVKQFCRLALQSPKYIKPEYANYLAIVGVQTDYDELARLVTNSDMVVPVLKALGILGNLKALKLLMEYLLHSDDEIRVEAGKSLNRITGANLTEDAIVVEQEEADVEVDEIVGGETPSKEGNKREVEIVRDCTDQKVWMAWFRENKGRFSSGIRYRYGKPFSPQVCLEEIEHPNSVYRDRQRAYYELLIHTGYHIPFEADWFIEKQLDAIKQWREYLGVPANKPLSEDVEIA